MNIQQITCLQREVCTHLVSREHVAYMNEVTWLSRVRDGFVIMEENNGFAVMKPYQRELIPLVAHQHNRSYRRLISCDFRVSIDQCFDEVLKLCRARGGELDPNKNWLGPKLAKLLAELHRQGYAHTVEVWAGGMLAAGSLGLSMGSFYQGLTSFHHVSNAGTAASFELLAQLANTGFLQYDAVQPSASSRRLGGYLTTEKTAAVLRTAALSKPLAFPQNPVIFPPQEFPVKPESQESLRHGRPFAL